MCINDSIIIICSLQSHVSNRRAHELHRTQPQHRHPAARVGRRGLRVAAEVSVFCIWRLLPICTVSSADTHPDRQGLLSVHESVSMGCHFGKIRVFS